MGRRVDGGRVVGLESDAVAHVVSLVVRHAVLAGHPHRGLEDLADRHPRLHRGDGRLLPVARGIVVAELLVARGSDHRGARDVRTVALVDAAQIQADEVARFQRGVGGVDVGERGPVPHRDHGEERLGTLAHHLLLERHRGLALGHPRLQHAEHCCDTVLGDQGRPLEPPHLLRTLDHSRGAKRRVGGHDRGPGEQLAQPLPGGREHARLVEADPLAERPEAAQDLAQRFARAGQRLAGDLPHPAADRPRRIGVVEEELAVAGEPVHHDTVGGHAGGVDEGDDEADALAREHPVQLEPTEEGVRDRAEPGHVLEILGRARHQGVEPLGVQHLREPRCRVLIHDDLLGYLGLAEIGQDVLTEQLDGFLHLAD